MTPVVGTFVNGTLCNASTGTPGIVLVDAVDLGVTQLIYTVTYRETSTPLGDFAFAAPGDGATVDLNVVTRLPQ